MKIVYLNPSGQPGGAEAVLLDVLAGMREVQPDWPLHLILAEPGPVVDRAAALGVQADLVPFPPAIARLGDAGAGGPAGLQVGKLALFFKFATAIPHVLAYCKQLRRAMAQAQPDIVHSNGFKMHMLGLWSRPRNVPVIWHVHDYVSKRPLMARLMRLCAGRCAAAVTNSHSVSADLSQVCPDLKVRTVLNAVDVARFAPEGPALDLDALAGFSVAPPGTVKVGLLATMARWKGHAVFLEALSKLPSDVPVRAYVIGGSLYQTEGSQWKLEELKDLAARLGVSGRVGFTGFLDRPEAAMRALDIVVHASTEPEPFGLVIVEAMACGRAVIVSLAGGVAEIVREGENGLSHAPGNAAQLAGCIQRLALDSELRSERASMQHVHHRVNFSLRDIRPGEGNSHGEDDPLSSEAAPPLPGHQGCASASRRRGRGCRPWPTAAPGAWRWLRCGPVP